MIMYKSEIVFHGTEPGVHLVFGIQACDVDNYTGLAPVLKDVLLR